MSAIFTGSQAFSADGTENVFQVAISPPLPSDKYNAVVTVVGQLASTPAYLVTLTNAVEILVRFADPPSGNFRVNYIATDFV